ncbi:phosphatase PAP2 family protein [Microvirga zambiensis]|uniref:phosphatase PAP2 family protein n=1 Tax=Microvirga zambiensis TaxID=1402137 RepID=UPI00191E9121|nr:phosphatase PAP2 family protein [Microvirga zambiensis]
MGNCFYDMPFLPEFLFDPEQPGLTEGRAKILTDVQSFPRRYWDPDYVGLAILPEFAGLRWEKEIKVDPPPAPDSDETRDEIAELLALMKERAHARAEIMAQNTDFPLYWLGLLMMNRSSHPATYEMIKVAARVAEMVMFFYKMKFNRPRPHQLCPALMPMVAVPGHASYPSGHSLMSHMLSHTGAEVRPDAADTLFALAERVGRNREIAGLHYRSDTKAGAQIAEGAFKVLLRSRSFQRLRTEARKEWEAQSRRRGG